MYLTSDTQERALIEAAIREAHDMRADYIAQAFIGASAWIKRAFAGLKAHTHSATGLDHSGHAI